MSYTSPHSAADFMKAACILVVHEYELACQRKQKAERKKLVLGRREIDLNSRLALFFGPEASISAQGTSGHDLRISAPVIHVEIKYLRRNMAGKQPVNPWTGKNGVKKDWNWLLGLKNSNRAFRKSCLVFFLPSQGFLQFHEVCALSASATPDGGPFCGLVTPDPSNAARFIYASAPWERDMLLQIDGPTKKRCVRRQVVGNATQPVWALVFCRVGTDEFKQLGHLKRESIKVIS